MFLKKTKTKCKKLFKSLKKTNKKTLLIFLSLSLLILSSLFFIQFSTKGKINTGIKIADIYVGNLNKEEAFYLLSSEIKSPEKIILTSNEKEYEINLNNIDFNYNFEKTIQKAFQHTRTGNFFYDFTQKIKLLFKKENLGLEITLDEQKLEEYVNIIAKELEIKPIVPNTSLLKGQIVIEKGQKGIILDYFSLRAEIGKKLASQEYSDIIEIPFKKAGDVLDDFEVEKAKRRAEKLIGKKLSINFNEYKYIVNDETLISFLDPKSEYFEEKIIEEIILISSEINRDPQNSVFVFEEGMVKEFTPSLDGYQVEKEKLKTLIIGNLKTLEQNEEVLINLDLPVKTTKPKIQNKDVNDLGIETLLGRGSSKFLGSIANRIYNIDLAAKRFKGILVAPGETLSFNKTLGDVSQETGFKQAYIIKEGKTILGDGGGVCQVSTTLFRAAMNAGLPILERQAHAYRVGYYEQDSPPGLDATVYAPRPDLLIKNDTPNYILIQSVFDGIKKTLIFEIYGTDDGRIAEVTKPIVSSVTPPGEDLYVDDPTLPAGTIKQIEYKAWGAKVKFDYTIKRNQEIIHKKTFYSNYQPWQAVYLKGTMP